MMGLKLVSDGGAPDSRGAAAWATRLDRGDLSESELNACKLWLEQPGNPAALERADAALRIFDGLDPEMPELAALRSEAMADVAAINAAAPHRRLLRFYAPWVGGALAASLAAIFLFAGQYGERANIIPPNVNRDDNSIASADMGATATYRTRIGETRAIALPDGSRITLDTQSEVVVDYRAESRQVRLLRGQALFDVAHAAQRPFTVQVSNHLVTALGTLFEVRVDRARVEVTLLKGRVRVDETAPKATKKSIDPIATLAPGQQFVAGAASAPAIEQIDIAKRTLWLRSLVEFDQDTIESAASELNRYSSKHILIKDPKVATMRISGIVRAGNPAEFAELIGKMLPISARTAPSGDIELRLDEEEAQKMQR